MDDTTKITMALERKAREFEANKETYTERIKEMVEMARRRLDSAERELLRRLDVLFGANVYEEQLAVLGSVAGTGSNGKQGALAKAAAMAALPVPGGVGPDDEAFARLHREIGRLADRVFSAFADAPPPPPAPRGLRAQGLGKGGFHDGVALCWAGVAPDGARCVERVEYKVQVAGERRAARVYDSAGTSCAFQNLRAGTTYAFRVLCVWDGVSGPWSDAVEFTTSAVPAARGMRCSEVGECAATIVWEGGCVATGDGGVSFTWEAEVREDEKGSAIRKAYSGEAAACTLKRLECGRGYVVRVRARVSGTETFGAWSDGLRFRTKKWSCAWKPCPASVDDKKKYILSWSEGRSDAIATKVSKDGSEYAIVIGNNPIPVGAVVSWEVKVERLDWSEIGDYSCGNYPPYYYVGVAPNDIDQNKNYSYLRGAYFDFSGYKCGVTTAAGGGGFFTTTCYGGGCTMTVAVDMRKREVTFSIGGVFLGAVEQIPIDKPLVPIAGLGQYCKSAELIIT